MALPVNITTITLTGRYIDFEGNPIAGQVKIYPSQVLIDAAADRIIIPNTLTADLVNGSFSLTVPVTNDPDVTASNPGTTYYYWYEEAFNGGSTYKIFIPSSYGATVDISAIRETATTVQYIQPVSGDLWPPIEVRTTAVESQYSNLPSLASPQQYQFLALKCGTYGTLASDYATYSLLTSSMTILFTTARLGTIIDRITRLDNATSATSVDLRDTTNGGSVTASGYGPHAVKWGTYQNWSNQYATYNLLTGASIGYVYNDYGNLLTQLGYALNGSVYDITSITDNWLKQTRVKTGNDYSAMTYAYAYLSGTYAMVATDYGTYSSLGGATFTLNIRDTADRLQTAATHPHPLLTRGFEYGISV
jgi:hypothetical protein